MEVVVHSTLNSIQGRVVVATDPNQTVDSLITAFCIEKGTPHRRQYVLRNKDLEVLSNHKKLLASGVQSGDILYMSIRDATDDWACGCNQWWLLASVALLIGCAGLVAITIIHIQQNQILYEYGAVVDAGSSHSQVYVYKWPGSKHNGTAIPQQVYSERIVPGISNYTDDPSKAGQSLEKRLEEAVDNIPHGELSNTPIYLGATAGMRLLNASDKAVSDAIMNSTRSSISKYGFKFTQPESQARILDGREEGSYGWVTANYLSGVFQQLSTFSLQTMFTKSRQPQTKGALDLGGASAQITFVPEDVREPNTTDHQNLILYGNNYTVYSHSYLCYGINEGHRQYLARLVLSSNHSSVIEDPCRPRGSNVTYKSDQIFDVPCTKNISSSHDNKNVTYTFTGTSNVTLCTSAVQGVFNYNQPCDDPPCSFDGVSQPSLYGEYLAFSGFYYTMSYLKLTDKKYTLKQFETATDKLCSKNHSMVLRLPPSDLSSEAPECFKAVYVHTLLVDGYHFNGTNWNSLTFTNTLGKADLGWTMGYMLNASYAIPVDAPEQRISTVLFVLLVLLFGVFLAIAVGFACHARNSKKRDAEYQRMASYGSI